MDYFYPKKAQEVQLPLPVLWAAADGEHPARLIHQGSQSITSSHRLLPPSAEGFPKETRQSVKKRKVTAGFSTWFYPFQNNASVH